MPAQHERLDPRRWLGRRVEVVVDRPIGSAHPRHPDLVYPVNYGFVPDTCAPDGQEVDAYVLGPDTPLTRFTGEVVAVVRRDDDVEDKLVVSDRTWSDKEVAARVRFQERFFMSFVVSASAANRPLTDGPERHRLDGSQPSA